MILEYTGIVMEVHDEDQHHARMATISDENEVGVFFRIQSWSDTPPPHPDFDALCLHDGARVKITLEVLE